MRFIYAGSVQYKLMHGEGQMPTVLRVKGYRFFFFTLEGKEPPHIHVEQAERYAKIWLTRLHCTGKGISEQRVDGYPADRPE